MRAINFSVGFTALLHDQTGQAYVKMNLCANGHTESPMGTELFRLPQSQPAVAFVQARRRIARSDGVYSRSH